VPVTLSVPDPVYLRGWLKRAYGMRGPLRVSLYRNGVNLTYYVDGRSGPCVLRVYSPGWRGKRAIDFELAQLLHLNGAGIPVSWPLPARDGAYALPLRLPDGPTHAVLFSFAVQGSAKRSKLQVYRGMGSALARLHAAQSAFKRRTVLQPLDQAGLIDRSMGHLRPYRPSFGDQWPVLVKTAAKLRARLAGLPKQGPAYGLIHGDAHLGNVHHDDRTGRDVFFDFDLSTVGWRIFDLAILLWVDALDGAKPVQLRRSFKTLCASYSALRPLGALELRMIPDMMAARHVWYMGFHAQGAERWGTQIVDTKTHAWKMGFLKRWNKGEIRKILL
jgi:Ser/Thr protein kinase RdoA (MazF antagonist)